MLDYLLQLNALLPSDFVLALLLFTLTSALIAVGVPGVVVPLSFSSGAMLGGWTGMAVIAAGVLVGSQALFLVVRYALGDRVRRRLGDRLVRFEHHVSQRGFAYLVALRVIGAPHFLVTAGSALIRLRAVHFAAATLLGVMPAIGLTAAAGAAI